MTWWWFSSREEDFVAPFSLSLSLACALLSSSSTRTLNRKCLRSTPITIKCIIHLLREKRKNCQRACLHWACCFCWHEVLAQRGRFVRFYYFNWCYYISLSLRQFFFHWARSKRKGFIIIIIKKTSTSEREGEEKERRREKSLEKEKAFIPLTNSEQVCLIEDSSRSKRSRWSTMLE